MLITAETRPEQLREPGLRWWSGERFVVGWKGHVAWPGEAGGTPTAARLSKELARAPLGRAVAPLLGVFGLFVYDRHARAWQVAGDNSGLYKIYHDGRRASTSFLELARGRAVSPERAVELICHGGIFGTDTLVDGVMKLGGDQTLALGHAFTLHPKELDAGGGIAERFEALARSCAGLKVSVDLTGGLDSRLNAVLLHSAGVACEAAVASWCDAIPDVALARPVARALGWPLHVSRHDVERLEDDLLPAFRDGDGHLELWSWHKDRQNALAHVARGVDLAVHGAGGNGFSDFYFQHEFPFYGRRDPDLGRFYDWRVLPTPPRFIAAEPLRELRARTIARFEAHRGATAALSCDAAQLRVRAPEQYGHQLSAYVNLGLDVAAPYLDLHAARAAARLPAWSRFHSGWHRRTMTALAPKLAALRTSSGHSASTSLRHLLPDLVGFTGEKARCAAKMAAQRCLGRELFARPDSIHPEYVPRLRATAAARAAIERLQATGILAPGLDPATMEDRYFARAVTVGMTQAALDQGDADHPSLPADRLPATV